VTIKKEIRVLGLAFSPSGPVSKPRIQVVGVVYRGNRWLEGAMRTSVPPEVRDLSFAVSNMVTGSPHFPQLRVIVLDELVTKSGHYVNIEALSRKTRLPVVAVLPNRPRLKRAPKESAEHYARRVKVLESLQSKGWRFGRRRFFTYSANLGEMDLSELLQVCASKEGVPEAARVARIAATTLERFFTGRPSGEG
jgi:endonuclease V-like protein UPF0215 family